MFGSNHYVPILRSKMAERLALRNLLPSDRQRITPLIELTPASFKARKRGEIRETPDPARVLDEEAKNLLEACGYSPFFLDVGFIDHQISAPRGNTQALEYLASLVRNYRLLAVLVTGLSRSVGYQSSVSRVAGDDGRGVCLRVTISGTIRSPLNPRPRSYALEDTREEFRPLPQTLAKLAAQTTGPEYSYCGAGLTSCPPLPSSLRLSSTS